MKKIRLDVEALRVQSYPTTDPEWSEGGTVDGHQQGTVWVCSGQLTCASACSETNGVAVCKSCGPCCIE
ncbi:MAG TPA: hypothetical protein VE871_15310 [Longimicrobium sp.]|nr:hypothetical protein [Longimicrobium sp.]